MKPIISLITCALFIIYGCRNSGVKYPPTKNIDTTEFSFLKKKFHLLDLNQADKNLGGLTPNYPIAIALQACEYSIEKDWMTGGFICVVPKPVIKIKDRYVVINDKQELKKTYAPITSPEEAMAYAILFTKGFPILDKNFFKKEFRYFNGTPSLSYSIKGTEGYEVKLFSYKTFGCDHPYTEVIFKVHEDGDVEKMHELEVFEDPKENGLCVD